MNLHWGCNDGTLIKDTPMMSLTPTKHPVLMLLPFSTVLWNQFSAHEPLGDKLHVASCVRFWNRKTIFCKTEDKLSKNEPCLINIYQYWFINFNTYSVQKPDVPNRVNRVRTCIISGNFLWNRNSSKRIKLMKTEMMGTQSSAGHPLKSHQQELGERARQRRQEETATRIRNAWCKCWG